MILATIAFRKAARGNYRKVRAAVSWTNSVLAENVNGVRVVQAFSRQEHNHHNFKDYVNRYYLETSLDAAKVASLFTPVVDVLGALATAVVVYVVADLFGRRYHCGCADRLRFIHRRFFEPIRRSESSLRYASIHDGGRRTNSGLLKRPSK